MLRKMDFSNIKKENDKSLEKKWGLFAPDPRGQRFRGRESFGPYTKQSKEKNILKNYYLAPHAVDEYFALEILQYLGMNTPKARFVSQKKEGQIFVHIATKSIPRYIPRDGILLENMTDHQIEKEKEYEQDSEQEQIPALLKMRERYRLDIRRQIFRDLQEKKEYKISGNLFAFDLMLTVVADPDAMAYTNYGFYLQDNRCYAIAIDKDQCAFEGGSYHELCQSVDDRIYEDEDDKKHIAHHLFHYREREQLLDVLYRLRQGLIPDKATGQCAFDLIFFNSRVKQTEVLSSYHCKEKCEKFKKSVRSTLDFYAKHLENHYLAAYAHREKLRAFIADTVLERLNLLKTHKDFDFIRDTIIQDLRGPYYKACFSGKYPRSKNPISAAAWESCTNRFCLNFKDLKNESLFRLIEDAVKKEFSLIPAQGGACKVR